MNIIEIEGTEKTPMVHFDPLKGFMEFKGKSTPENAVKFYHPLLEWLELYSHQYQPKTEVNIYLDYFNSSSSKCILDIFKKLEMIQKSGGEVEVNWYFKEYDEDTLEAGEDYKSILKLNFNLIEIN